jgi:hypothetical protein
MPPVAVADSENRPLRFKIMSAGTVFEFKDRLSPRIGIARRNDNRLNRSSMRSEPRVSQGGDVTCP